MRVEEGQAAPPGCDVGQGSRHHRRGDAAPALLQRELHLQTREPLVLSRVVVTCISVGEIAEERVGGRDQLGDGAKDVALMPDESLAGKPALGAPCGAGE